MLNLIIEYGAMEMLLDIAVSLANTDYDKFLSMSDKALRNAGRHRIRLMIERLIDYRKVINERVILKDGRRLRYVEG